MAEHFRIDELTRRLEQDPSSIAFAQLAEALRRADRVEEAIEACRAGLVHHPDYLSAHVTLGRALIEQGDLDAAETELQGVLAAAPENLAAIRGLAEIHQRRGQWGAALAQYRRALTLAPHDAELEETVSRLAAGLDATSRPSVPGAEAPGVPPVLEPGVPPVLEPGVPPVLAPGEPPVLEPGEPPVQAAPAGDAPAGPTPAAHQVAALERWLDAILADRERQA